MGLLELIITIALVGLIVWVVTTLIPMPTQFKTAIIVISVVFVVIWVLRSFGMFHGFHDIRIK